MKLLLNILLIFILSQKIIMAQGGFVRSIIINNTINNTSQAVFETTPNNYIACGMVVENYNGYQSNRLTLIGLNGTGQQQWVKKYGNAKFEYLDNFIRSKWFSKIDNYLYLATTVRDSNNIYLGAFLKINYNGDTLWQKKFYDVGFDVVLQDVVKSVDGGFLITGFFQNSTSSPILLIKTDANGNELWRKKNYITTTGGCPNVQDGKAIIQDSASKKIITVGYQYKGDANYWTSYSNIVVFDSLGNFINRSNFPINTPGALINLVRTKDKKIVGVGYKGNEGTFGNWDLQKLYAVKFDFNTNTVIWQKHFDNPSPIGYFNNVLELPNEDLIVAGPYDTSYVKGLGFDLLGAIYRLDKNGSLVLKKQFKYPPYNNPQRLRYLYSLQKTSDNGYISSYYCMDTNPNRFLIVKYDSTLCDSSAFYCNPVGLKDINYLNEFVRVYPNPTNGILNIALPSTGSSFGSANKIEIVNSLGQVLQTTNILNQTTIINVKELTNGIYFLKVFDKDKLIGTTKIVKE